MVALKSYSYDLHMWGLVSHLCPFLSVKTFSLLVAHRLCQFYGNMISISWKGLGHISHIMEVRMLHHNGIVGKRCYIKLIHNTSQIVTTVINLPHKQLREISFCSLSGFFIIRFGRRWKPHRELEPINANGNTPAAISPRLLNHLLTW